MYAAFFGLQQQPFSIAPDPRYLFMSARHREALAHLLYGLQAGGGFVLLTGEVGTGKTTVCRCFLEQIPAHCNVAYIFNPRLTVLELLRSICDEFGVTHTGAEPGAAETVKDCIDPLNAFLLAQHAQGRNNVLIIDEAQNLAADVLEQLRLLTNLETNERKLLQIILIGQPELRSKVAAPELEQLAQRVIARYHLQALSPDETRQYIAHRMAVAGLHGALPLTHRAVQRVHHWSAGIPRRINVLCDRALLGAYAAQQTQVTPAIVNQAAREVFDQRPSAAAGRWPWAAGGALAGLGVALALTLLWGERPQALTETPAHAPATGHQSPPAISATPKPAQTAQTAIPLPQGEMAETVTAQAAAPSTSAAPAQAAAPVYDRAFFQAQALLAEPQLWQQLAALWRGKLSATQAAQADPCSVLAAQNLRCLRRQSADWDLLRQLDRPALLRLQWPSEAEGAAAEVTVLLLQIQGQQAVLQGADGQPLLLPLTALQALWRGALWTLWRIPAQVPERADISNTEAGANWLARQLQKTGALPKVRQLEISALRAAVLQFQQQQGIKPDGKAGPLTLILLNRALGVPEPRLHRRD